MCPQGGWVTIPRALFSSNINVNNVIIPEFGCEQGRGHRPGSPAGSSAPLQPFRSAPFRVFPPPPQRAPGPRGAPRHSAPRRRRWAAPPRCGCGRWGRAGPGRAAPCAPLRSAPLRRGHGHPAPGRPRHRPAAAGLRRAGGRAEPQPDGAAGAADGAGAGGHLALPAGAARCRAQPVPHRGRAGPLEGEPHGLPAPLPLQRPAARRLPPVSDRPARGSGAPGAPGPPGLRDLRSSAGLRNSGGAEGECRV